MSSVGANGRAGDPRASVDRAAEQEPKRTSDGVECVTEFAVVNEFAGVRIRQLRTRTGERVEIESIELGYSIRLDALALEALSWQSPDTISAFLETPFGPEDDGPR